MTAPWSDEVPVPVTVGELSAVLEGQLTDEVLQEAIRLGYLDVDGDRVVRVSRRLLDMDTIASLFLDLVITHVIDRPPARHRRIR